MTSLPPMKFLMVVLVTGIKAQPAFCCIPGQEKETKADKHSHCSALQRSWKLLSFGEMAQKQRTVVILL